MGSEGVVLLLQEVTMLYNVHVLWVHGGAGMEV